MSGPPLGVAVIGCGLIGRRRAEAAAAHPGSRLITVADRDGARAAEVAAVHGCEVAADWESALARPDVDVVVASTPNDLLAGIACAALGSGRHVLIEKPMGRNAAEAASIAGAAEQAKGGALLKIGFNHRYHPAIARAHELAAAGAIGRIVSLRARYGHGSRPGCEKEWRGDPVRAGGGELIDQGVHIADLFHWFAGMPTSAFGMVQTAVWPLGSLEDNAYGLFRWSDGAEASDGGDGAHGAAATGAAGAAITAAVPGAVGQLHVSMTQWKNLFSLEVSGETGALLAEGLGGSYGPERLTHVRRRMEGGVPETTTEEFPGPDASWTLEWADFVEGVRAGRMPQGGAADGLAAMRMVDALYRSAARATAVAV